jgi:hypothetical protein
MSFEDVRPVSEAVLPSTADRRVKLRIDVLGQIDAHSVWRLRPMHLRELSETGFSTEATGPFECDVVHKFRIGTEGHGRSVVVQARVKHRALVSMAGPLPIYVTGFELVNLSDRALRDIRWLLQFADSMWKEDGDGEDY